jgi:multidrug efflux pump subunit AcrB
VTFTPVVSTVDETRGAYEATFKSLLEGMVLASLAVLLFLQGLALDRDHRPGHARCR